MPIYDRVQKIEQFQAFVGGLPSAFALRRCGEVASHMFVDLDRGHAAAAAEAEMGEYLYRGK